MQIPDQLMRYEEKMIFTLRALYSSHGYSSYKMNKFEEYDLYMRNKDFLVSDGVITFTDTNGRLMALKPDVTLSIVKNSRYRPGEVQKVYYDEKVYRVSAQSGSFREITQMGLEALGDLDTDCVAQVLRMAMLSLEAVSPEYVLTLSHPGLLSRLLEEMNLPDGAREEMLGCIARKALHEARQLAEENGVSTADIRRLESFLTLTGKPLEVLDRVEALLPSAREEIEETRRVLALLPAENLRMDFSVPGNMRYYSGIVFAGYVPGVPSSVLSGGRYDLLMKRVGKKGGAIGFAVYLDLLSAAQGREGGAVC